MENVALHRPPAKRQCETAEVVLKHPSEHAYNRDDTPRDTIRRAVIAEFSRLLTELNDTASELHAIHRIARELDSGALRRIGCSHGTDPVCLSLPLRLRWLNSSPASLTTRC